MLFKAARGSRLSNVKTRCQIMSKDLLLEIGTEEIPAHFMPGILQQLKEKAENKFKQLHIDTNGIKTLGTPRRLALLVNELGICMLSYFTKSPMLYLGLILLS